MDISFKSKCLQSEEQDKVYLKYLTDGEGIYKAQQIEEEGLEQEWQLQSKEQQRAQEIFEREKKLRDARQARGSK